ncbi:G-type lectin S-receptor-like serine/threonine-protein kinase At2g19130 [Rutidosis leptorrhynchoides]|uniref:G-type lectin S-receptor-like serine/threonine-protein kinase At2g19130 n=1 Tax=Rutidosis leptorrhynchoides TaxID=125765 RepID=UPI003A994662
MILNFFLCLSVTISVSYGGDTMFANSSLSGDETLVSKGENFELGFFKAGNSFNYYIGIWYKNYYTNPPTIIWVANRDTPIFHRFDSELKIIDGNLVLLNESKLPIWSTNVTASNLFINSTISVVILDNGNLVLRDGSDSVEPIWQSFDHPTNTWMPGAKFGYNKRTNKSQHLTSWKSVNDPGVGLYSTELHPFRTMIMSKWNGTQQYWDTGSWNPLMGNPFYNYSYQTNENESYFTFSPYDPSTVSRYIMDVSGQFEIQTWSESIKQWNILWAQPETKCMVYALCGPYGFCRSSALTLCNCLTGFQPRSESNWNLSDFSDGCVRKTGLDCGRNIEKQDFLMIKVTSLPLNSSVVTVGGAGECHVTCLNDCSCNAYSFIDHTCSIWNEELLNLSEDDVNGKTIFVKVASKDLPHHRKNGRVKMGIVVGSTTGAVFILGILFIIIYKRKIGFRTRVEGTLVAYAYRYLQIATKNFSVKLGGGGFGSVFKGVLRDSSIVAVKKLESISQGEKQFRSEVKTIGSVQHVNLVRLCGFCAQSDDKLLVYDYMPNGSLHSYLFNDNKQDNNILSWQTRFEIARGVARRLVYLHDKCIDCIIHCDIKPENILLDANFCPKIADFGLAKLVGRDFSRVLTSMRGTRGYLAPEWLTGVAVKAKSDVYSYGMMLFELVHGKRNVEQPDEDYSFTFFPSLAANVVMGGGDILSLVDSRLNGDACVEEVIKVFKVAYWCIQDEEENRPSMSQVERILDGVLDVNMPPIPQSFKFYVDNMQRVNFFSEFTTTTQFHE